MDADRNVTATFAVSGRDLIVSAVTSPPALAAPGSAYAVTDTTTNQGALPASASTTRFYLSVDAVKSANDVRLSGSRLAPSLDTGASSTGSANVMIPNSMSPGVYWQLACADDTRVVAESNELNNCLASAQTIEVQRPDLIEADLSEPPAALAPGGNMMITDTAQNVGAVTATATATRHYLSLDGAKDGSDILLGGSRSVPILPPGATSSGSKSVTVPAATPLGTYRVLACADDSSKLAESNEGNNCRASGSTLVVAWPDLVTTAVSDPPAGASPGGKFTIAATVLNQGAGPAGASTTRYFLSVDSLKDAGDVLLAGTRSVVALAPGATSAGSKQVTIPLTTPSGLYLVLACADDLVKVAESDEANNCRPAGTKVSVQP